MDPSNVTKILLYIILVLPNVTIELSNVKKKIKVLLNVTKVQLKLMLALFNVTIDKSN